MKVYHTLICFFFFMLQDGNIGLINAEIHIHTKIEGQSITVQCNFTTTGDRRYFCKDECEEKILEMDGVSAQRGRYSMRYETTHTRSRLDVTITHLTKSDSGRYGCGLDKYAVIDPYQEFEIIVTDASTTTRITTTTTTQSFRRSSTSSTFSAQTTNQSEKEQTEKTTAGGVLLYVRLTLVIIVILFSVAVLIHKKRASKPKEHPEETECANVTETSPVYEEIREGDGQSRSPPVENSVEASAVYSLAPATASYPMRKLKTTGVKSSTLGLIFPTETLPHSAAPPLVM
ncbi:uncharacterized protein LOC133987937 [Scomber scombrus]|uniref:uncharacterized protein LOC133987937 n=1 Tax=Scomber scombrus TaxID=13677 RepID=UPI002DDC33DB|nr:uncharacterized protein LOC133987937 [Scomber scombrus]